ncbi:Hypothetical protein Bdt_2593 [Bdellovibrio bacteriovorus str. Tiberius]|uniref:Uncharacterized protein n=2 Tax=Bdellovibrio bacteriovorus TaxID=959 RepID=K7YQW2_BDEBC|nr:Hypothetical protein Bdt_2593 [Bdellovibrio bacteriovorus str. Tiberius]
MTIEKAQARVAWLRRCLDENNGAFLIFTKENAKYFGTEVRANSVMMATRVNYPIFGDDQQNWAPGDVCRVPEEVRFLAVCEVSVSEKVVMPNPFPPQEKKPEPKLKPQRPPRDICPPRLCQ